MIAPVVVSMTKYLFAHYRLQMYAYLNNSLRSGMLKRIVGFSFTNRTINREVCTFKGVNYWRMDRLNFWADVSVTLLLSTAEGKREWCGYLCFWFSAEQLGPLTGTIEELTSVKDGPERSGMTLLSPFLIPYFTAAKIDMEAENIWAACIPGALDHPELRKAEMLAGAMGLSILHLPLHKNEEVDSILFLVDDQIEIVEKGKQPEIREILANTIVINTSNIKKEYSDFNILHECIHYYEHYLFFRLQEMHHNDIQSMETQEIERPEDGEKTSNPAYWMEKQADRGAYGLLMPITFMRGLLAEKCRMLKPYAHEGEKYEQLGLAIAEELSLPHFRVRARMIPMGHVHAKGALNYVDRHRIRPYSFDEASLRKDEHTFNISRITAGGLYEKNADFRELLDSGKYVYANGHIVRNDPRFAEQTPYGYVLTPLALQRIDLCCLRFIRIYEQKNVSRYIFGRMNYDPDYVKRTLFYLEDLINEFFEITRFNLSGIALEYSIVNLSLMLEQLSYEFQPMLAQKHLNCVLNVQPDMIIKCDSDKLQRVFDNLLRNAVNYSYENQDITITASRTQSPNNKIKIIFENKGIDIPKEKLERIFEQFYRLDSSRATKTGGAGLGLAIAKEIVELHKGSIAASCTDGVIRFEVLLPV